MMRRSLNPHKRLPKLPTFDWRPFGVAVTLALGVIAPGCSKGPDDRDDRTIRFSDVGWTDITSTTAIASQILNALGYAVEIDVLSVAVTYASLKNEDIDVFLGNWMPAQEDVIGSYVKEGSIEVLGMNLEGAKYTLAVPRYAAQAGLRDFSDVARFHKELDSKIYGIEPGNEGNLMIADIIAKDTFGLGDFELVVSSEQGMLTQVQKAIQAKQWIVFLGWAPHPMNTNFEITYLSGGDETFGPNYGEASVHTVVRRGFAKAHPNVTRFLRNLVFTLEMENEMMGLILDDGRQPSAAAKYWLGSHPDILRRWMEGVTTYDGEPAWPTVERVFVGSDFKEP